ncbi:OsmC family protein [Sphingomonas morindae]|uniref:OsmC family protein n=1 Tax=Sphingomonas morindae TaxID=1541170 RepID=A0ABY4X7J8_9SPHN|nr:OsmC family protein [Sphingomonas morindae]USI72851.1 OsmC family protein [Sphingomonas morindae]
MAKATAHIGPDDYRVDIESGAHRLVADEPASRGGEDVGPAPYDLLLAALGACTAITLRMYADRHDWAIRSLDVDLRIVGTPEGNRIRRVLRIDGPDAAARARLADIAERTPVTLTVKNGMPVETTLAEDRHD